MLNFVFFNKNVKLIVFVYFLSLFFLSLSPVFCSDVGYRYLRGEKEFENSFSDLMNINVNGSKIGLDVPYVATPQSAVERMIQLAEVKPGEVVYDLGCGDGRILVTAAQRYRVKAIGVDLDPERVKESIANAEKAGVEDLVTVTQGDIFEQDLKDADVVFLYLFSSLNTKLLPQLEKMKPGSRVISFEFPIRGIQPDHVERIVGLITQRPRNIYKYELPFKKALGITWENDVIDVIAPHYTPIFPIKFKGVNNSQEDIRIVQSSVDCNSCADLFFSTDIVKPGQSVELLANVRLGAGKQKQSGAIVIASEAGILQELVFNITYPVPYHLNKQLLTWGNTREPKNFLITFHQGSGYRYSSHRFEGGDFRAEVLRNDPSGVVFQVKPLTSSRSRSYMYIELESRENFPSFKDEIFIPLNLEHDET